MGLVVAGIGLGNAAFQAGNLAGAALGLAVLVQAPLALGAVVAADAAFLLLWLGRPRWLEAALQGIVALMLGAFVLALALVPVDWGAALEGLLVPRVPVARRHERRPHAHDEHAQHHRGGPRARVPHPREALHAPRGLGGRGRFRGGEGLVRELELLEPAVVSLLTGASRPWGLAGGEPGRPGRNEVLLGGRWRTLPSKATLALPAGAVVRVEAPGGGGWGAPRKAKPREGL